MSRVLGALRHGFALLVDDGWLAAATVAWLLLCGFLRSYLTRGADWEGAVLFLGLVAILAGSAIRRARLPR